VMNANQEATRFGYDSLNHVTDLWDGKNNHTIWQYNEYGWLTKQGGRTHPQYISICPQRQRLGDQPLDAGERQHRLHLRQCRKLEIINYPLSTINYFYDALNRLRTMLDAVGTTTFSYTPAGQLASETARGPMTA